jgi:FK506-binding protein 4/5
LHQGTIYSCKAGVNYVAVKQADLVIPFQVLELDSQNVKALYRRVQAYIQLADLELAEADIKKALEIDPDNRYSLGNGFCKAGSTLITYHADNFGNNPRDVKLEYKILKEKIKEYNKKDAKFYSNMFAKMTK